jgi:drug/metabolite transporter (DMT)-like permease
MTLVPVISTLVAWVWLGETLRPAEMGAILLAVGGIAWVVAERGRAPDTPSGQERRYALGVLLGLGGALGQALGLVTAKQGLAGNFPSLSATVIRMIVASGVIWLLTLVRGQVGPTWRALGDRRALLFIAGGSLIGPFVGVWLSMVAVQYTRVGIASTLMALSPIILIPLDHWIFREKASPRSIAGTVVALAGASVLFLT